jgi:hypothetical protein
VPQASGPRTSPGDRAGSLLSSPLACFCPAPYWMAPAASSAADPKNGGPPHRPGSLPETYATIVAHGGAFVKGFFKD